MLFRLVHVCLAALVLTTMLAVDAAARTRGARIADLMELRDIGGPYAELAVSPRGDIAAVIERRTNLDADRYEYSAVAIELTSGRARTIGDAGEFVLRSDGGRYAGIGILRRPQFSADGRYLYYLRGDDGAIAIWRAAIDGGGAERFVRAAGDIRRFRVFDGAIFYETSTPRAELAADVAHNDRRGFAVDPRFTPSYSLTPWPEVDRSVRTWRLDLESGETTQANADAIPADDPRPRVQRLDPSSIVDEPETGLFDASGARCPDPICSGPITQTWDLVEADGSEAVLFQRSEGHARRETALRVWRPGGDVRLIWRGDARTEGCAPAAHVIVCLQDTSLQPRRVVSIDITSGALRTLYDPNPQWHVASPRIERFDYTDAEGNESFAHLVYPLGWRRGRLYPLVIVQYRSRGFLLGGTGDETPVLPLSAAGYFVLNFDRPEFRARSQRMSLPALQRETELDGVERGAKREALDAFIARALERGADPARIAITGLSDGAETAYAMMMDEPIFAAAVVSTPPTDPIGWALQSSTFRRSRVDRIGMTGPWEDGAEPWRGWWRDNSPAFHVANLHAPILFNLAEAEALRAFPLITRLDEAGGVYDAYIYPGAYHLKWRPGHLLAVQQRTLDWLDFWLRNVERADPDEPERLERWRALRRRQQDQPG